MNKMFSKQLLKFQKIGFMFNNQTILITGGTGSFGHDFIKLTLSNFSPKKVIIFLVMK